MKKYVSLLISLSGLYIAFLSTVTLWLDSGYESCIRQLMARIVLDFVLHFTTYLPLTHDMFIHHVCVTGFWVHFVTCCHDLGSPTFRKIALSFLGMEISSIFYGVTEITAWCRRNMSLDLNKLTTLTTLLTLNAFLFASTFIYTRIYTFYCLLVRDTWFYQYLSGLSWIHAYTFGSTAFVIFGLNIYWAIKIVQKILRKI